jgi:hypothetical protein
MFGLSELFDNPTLSKVISVSITALILLLVLALAKKINDRRLRLLLQCGSFCIFIASSIWLVGCIENHHSQAMDRLEKEAASWSAVNGYIILSKIDVTTNRGSNHTYRPVVWFKYIVNAKFYTSAAIDLNGCNVDGAASGPNYESANSSYATQICNFYRPCQSVHVYFNPSKPEFGVLNRSWREQIEPWKTP